jgi:hypothetical protein
MDCADRIQMMCVGVPFVHKAIDGTTAKRTLDQIGFGLPRNPPCEISLQQRSISQKLKNIRILIADVFFILQYPILGLMGQETNTGSPYLRLTREGRTAREFREKEKARPASV